MRAIEFIVENTDEPTRIKLGGNNQAAKNWITKVYQLYPTTFQNNHVMLWGEGDDQQMATFELTPSFTKRGAVEVKWISAYPQRQGVGSKAMRELQRLAQEDNISLTLFPWDKGQVSQSKLTKFYKGQGFKPTVKGAKTMFWDPSVNEEFEMKEDASTTTLAQLYDGNYPDRDETFWDYVSPSEFNTPLSIQTLPKHKVMIMLLGQYRAEHIDDLTDMLDNDRKELVQSYVDDPALSNKVIVLSGDRIIDGNHRALAAAIKGAPINYIDLDELDEQDIDEEVLDEMPLPADWDPQQMRQQSTSFKSRLAYALERAKKLGTGSSRVAIIIEYQGRPTVLKIAKNAKGLAQNSVEADILSDGYASQMGILIPIIDYDTQNREPSWVHTELAQKVTKQQLCKLMGCSDLTQPVLMAENMLRPGRSSLENIVQEMREKGLSEEQIETCTEYANKLAELKSSFDVELGDLYRPANWGLYQGKPVIIDVGFNSNVYQQYYKR